MPKLPRFVAAAVGRPPAEKLEMVENALFALCKHIEDRGYSFGDMADNGENAPVRFFAEDENGARRASELVRFLLGVIWAEEIVKDRGMLVPIDTPVGFDLKRN
jgi:hypothetical protein